MQTVSAKDLLPGDVIDCGHREIIQEVIISTSYPGRCCVITDKCSTATDQTAQYFLVGRA